MAENNEPKAPSSAGITFGKIIAGAGMMAGAVLVGVAIYNGLGLDASSWFTKAAETTTEAAAATPTEATPEVPNVFTQIGDYWKRGLTGTDPMASGVIGSSLLGAGYGLSGVMSSKQEALNEAYQDMRLSEPKGPNTARLQTAALNSLVEARIIANDPRFVAEMAGRQQG